MAALLGVVAGAISLWEMRLPRIVIVRRNRMLIFVTRRAKRYVFPISAIESITYKRQFHVGDYYLCLTVREIGEIRTGMFPYFQTRSIVDRLDEIVENDAAGYYE